MNDQDFELYEKLLKEKSGLVLTPDKIYLIDSRLSPIAKKWGHPSLEALTTALRSSPDESLINEIIEAMTTNETSFFRDSRPFDLFKDFALPHILTKNAATKKIRIWCAAASSGQEPYSLAMLIKEQSSLLAGWNIEIIATDISHDILATAKEGVYTQFEVQRGLPITLLVKYFTQNEEKWHISDEIKKMVTYNYFNLLNPMNSMGQFDLIFCRNVLIYFDPPTKAKVLEKMELQLNKDGFLFLGGAETVMGITDKFTPVPEKRGIYAPTSAAKAAENASVTPITGTSASASNTA